MDRNFWLPGWAPNAKHQLKLEYEYLILLIKYVELNMIELDRN